MDIKANDSERVKRLKLLDKIKGCSPDLATMYPGRINDRTVVYCKTKEEAERRKNNG